MSLPKPESLQVMSPKFEGFTVHGPNPLLVLKRFYEPDAANPITLKWETVRGLIEKPQNIHKYLPDKWIYDDADVHEMLSIMIRHREAIYRSRESQKQREHRLGYSKGGK